LNFLAIRIEALGCGSSILYSLPFSSQDQVSSSSMILWFQTYRLLISSTDLRFWTVGSKALTLIHSFIDSNPKYVAQSLSSGNPTHFCADFWQPHDVYSSQKHFPEVEPT
jgi:hypothetical protein